MRQYLLSAEVSFQMQLILYRNLAARVSWKAKSGQKFHRILHARQTSILLLLLLQKKYCICMGHIAIGFNAPPASPAPLESL